MKKPLMILFALIVCVMNGACLTSELYSKSRKIEKPSFDEDVNSFLITNDQQKLVIIGKKHHYIFPLYNDLREILMWNGRAKIMATNLHFVISKGNKINGQYNLKPRNMSDLSNSDRVFLVDHDFIVDEKNMNKELVYSGNLTNGTVYDAGKFEMPTGQSFNKPYHLTIRYNYASALDYAELALLTPVAVTADGLIVVGAVAASPIILFFVIADRFM